MPIYSPGNVELLINFSQDTKNWSQVVVTICQNLLSGGCIPDLKIIKILQLGSSTAVPRCLSDMSYRRKIRYPHDMFTIST